MSFSVQKIDDKTIKVKKKIVTKKDYIQLFKNALKLDHSSFFKEIKNDFNFTEDEIFNKINEFALNTQVCIKGSQLMWLHGHLLYLSLNKYLNDNKDIKFINIIETGTARGFSSLCMAKALYDNNRQGKIYTFDIIPHNKKMYWNCIDDFDGKKTREELLVKNKHLLKYIDFISGDSKKTLENINLERIHFSFLDARHEYKYLNHELQFVKKKQLSNDVIICDDYTFYNDGTLQYPGINKAIDQFTGYIRKVYYGNDGTKKRGYVFLQKN